MYFNRKNAEQKNWRMIKKGKHFLFGCSLVFAVGASLATQVVHANTAETTVANNSTTGDVNPTQNGDGKTYEAPAAVAEIKPEVTTTPAVAAKLDGETAKEVKALDKTKLENYIAEIEAKLANGTYDNKTEESVAVLKADLEAAKATLANATTQDEITKAYNKLVTTANTKLKNKPVEKKETPAVDTTNGKETVGKKAENTEKKSESNSIENTGSNDPRNGKALDKNNAFRAEVAYSEGTNAAANGHSDAYILNDVNKATSTDDAVNAVSRVTNYKVKYNKDASGKITSLDWLVFYNDHAENLANVYNTDGGDVYRNFIQIPAEVNMPTSITRAKYNSPINPKFINGKVQRIKPDGSALSNSVTFENPAPATAAGLPLDKKDTFSLASGWESGIYGRSIEKLAGQEDRYFKSAASDSSPRTKQLVYGAVLNDKRLIVDRSTTGGDGNDAYAWSFRTEVPETTTNEQLKDMKVVFGMMRSATAGANAGFANIATNPVKMWQSDVSPEPTAKNQTVKVGAKPDATKSIGNLDTLPKGTTVKYKDAVDTQTPGEKQATVVVTYLDTSTKEVPVKVIVEKEAVAPAKPVITTSLTGKANTKTPVEVKAEAGSTVSLFAKDGTKLGTAVANAQGVASITPTVNIPAGIVAATATKNGKTSEVSDAVEATPATDAATNKPAAGAATSGPEIVNNLAGKASTPADVTVKAPAGSTVKLYNKDGVVIGEAVANAQGVATVHPTNSLPAGEITATSTPVGGKESAKSAPITVTASPVTVKDGGVTGNNDTRLLVSKSEITVYPGDNIDIDVVAQATALEKFSVEKNPTAIKGVVPSGGYLGSSNGATIRQRDAKYSGTVAMDQPAGTTEVVFHAKNRDKPTTIYRALIVNVLETAKKYEPVAGKKVDVADSNNLSGDDKSKVIAAVKAANPSLPADSQYSVDEKGNLTITYPDGSTDKIAAAYLVNKTAPAVSAVAPTVEIPYSNKATKEVYVYGGEENSFDIKFKDDSGKIASATVNGGGNQPFKPVAGEENKINAQYGYTANKITAETPATDTNPAVITYRGTPAATDGLKQETLDAATKGENPQGMALGWRYATATDADGASIENRAVGSSNATDPGSFRVMLKPQTQKYDITIPAETEKVVVANPSAVTDAEFAKVKEKLKIEFSKTNNDANLAKDQGKNVEDKDAKIKTIEKVGNDLVVTYKDGSQDKKPLSEFVRTNEKPTVEIQYSDPAPNKKEVYVYASEVNSFDIKIKDDSGKISSATLRQGGNRTFAEVPGATNKISTQYGYTANTITAETPATEASPAVITYSGTPAPEGNFTQDKLDAATRGETPPGVVLGWRFLRVTDADGGEIAGSATGADDPGSFVVILKPQTQKYDVTTPENEAAKLPVVDANNVTDAEFAKIVGANNANIKLHYSKKNADANLVSKQGQNVDDKEAKIKSVEKVANNMVVTYKDGSTDTLPLTDFARTNQKPTVEIQYSDPAPDKKEVYVYASEVNSFDIKIKDDSGKLASAELRRGSNQEFKDVAGEPNKQDTQYGFTANKFTSETTATAENPAVITYTGTPAPEGAFTKEKFEKAIQDGGTPLGWRFVKAIDKDGEDARGNGRDATDPTAVNVILKPQTLKYDIKTPATKVPVADANNVTDAEFEAIKDSIKIQYSTENPDNNLVGKRGEEVENQSDRIASITKDGNNVVVTYKDGSKDSKPLTDFARTNPAPTVELPYSNADKRQIYVYTGENTDLTFKASDDAEVKDLYLRGPGGIGNDNTAGYGFTTGKIDNDVVTNGEGTVSDDKRTATIKMTGVTTLTAPNKWTSFVVANDNDNARSLPEDQNFDASTDDAVRQQKPGYVEFIVKSQTDKYDIKAPTEKVAVTDPANVTEAELAKIKEKLQLEHNQNNDDANISKDAPVTDKDAKIKSVTKDDQGNLVVTYADGSKDTRPLSEFVTLDKQPAIDEVNKAADEQIKAINDNAAATKEEKDAAIEQVNADKKKALDEIAKPEVTTKGALDKAQTAGTAAIAKDNPVVAAKPEAKKAIDEAVKAKEAAIDARTDLTDDEKKAAKDAAKAAADKAKAAVDAATTDAEVTKAKEAGTTAVANVTPVAKAEAKKAIAKALEDKNSEIDKRTDLTDEEKTAAKKEAQDKADAQLAKIKEQPDAAATPAAAKTAQDVVDAAKKTGVADVKAVDPVAKAKPETKKAIDKALEAKNQEIDARTDLTPEEKTKAKEVAKAQADVAKDAVDAATTNAAVAKAKADGTTAVANVTPVVKEAAKQAIADELAEKEKAIDARKDLTDAEKAKAKEEAQAKAKEATDAINKQPDVATTPTAAKTAQDAVDAAKAKGVADVKAVNPVAKEAAKQAIADELAKKVGEIDARPDLTDKEKDAAKKDAQAKAKKATDAINSQPDNATTPEAAKAAQDAVDAAKAKGVADVKAVNPVAKEKAKEEIAKELAKKEAAIDARPDLTDEEKAAAKKDAQAKAKAATDAIDAQPSIAETPEKAAEAKKAVDGAKDKGVADVKAVNPEAVTKPAAKQAIDDALKAKEAAIDAREDLTPAEKAAAKKAAEKAADDAKKAIDAATTDAAVEAAKNAGTGEVAKVNPVAKEKAKEEIAKELAKKEAAIDGRKDLTDEEKAAAKKEAQDKAKAATDAINDQPANAETPEKAAEAQTAVDAAKKSGVDEVAAVNPEAVTKPAAKKAIEDKLAKQLEDIANTPDATDEEKKVAADAAKALAEEAKGEIDKAGTDAEVKQLQEQAEGEIEKSVPVVEDKPNARKAIDEEATAKKAEIDARTDLTPKAKAKLKAKVDKVAEKSKAAIDAVSSVDDVNTIEEADKAAIKAIGEVNRPIDKVLVTDPSALTDEEKAKILEEVKKVNPTAKEVKYDENGNIEVTTEAGDKGIINPTKLVKTEDQLDNGKGGNDINKPLDKVIVKDPSNLTDEEKAKIVAKVEEVNPDAIVTIDEDGTVSVSTPDGKTAAIPASELVRTKEDTAKPDAGNSKIVKPADKVAGEANDPDDQAKAEEKLRELNPETKSVKFDEDGNATVTLKDGTTATIPSEDLFKSEVDATKPNAGNDIVKPADKTVVANPAKLTDAEKKAIEDKVKAVNPDATVVVDDKGNATVTTPEGKTAVIPAADLTKSSDAEKAPKAGNDIVKPASKTKVANPDALTLEEKKAIADKVSAVNPGSTVVVDDKGNATVTLPNGKIAVIPASDLTKSEKDVNDGKAKDNAVTPASKTKVANPEKLTDAEKKAIADKVKAANPGAEVVVDDKGNATVVKDGNVSVIPSTDLVKVQDDATKPNGGNDANTPAAKTVVKDPAELQDVEKKAIEDKVSAVNPGSTVVVDDQGNATVTKGDGTVLNIPASDLVIPAEKLADEATNAKVKTPAIRTLVGNKDSLTDTEKAAVKKSIEAVNPGATVVVDDKGNATVTMPDGSTATISKEQLVKDKDAVSKSKHGGDNLDIDLSKVEVADLANITPEEKAKFQFMILDAINSKDEFNLDEFSKETDEQGNTVYTSKDSKVKITIDKDGNMKVTKDGKTDLAVNIDKDGNVTIVTKEGQVLAIPRDDAFKQRPAAQQYNGYAGNTGNPGNTASKVDKAKLESGIRNLDSLIASQADQLDAAKAKEAKALLAEAKEVFAKANATQAEVDAMVKRLEEFKLNQASVATDDQAANNAANASNGETSEDATDAKLAANVSKRNNQKELPNTGTSTLGTVLPAIAALLSGVGVFATKKKEDE